MTPAIHTDDAANTLTNHPDVREHALAVLSNRSHTDGETVKATVLRALHREHPAVSLEDILELSVLVSVPEEESLAERVDTVLSEAVDHHSSWVDTDHSPVSNQAVNSAAGGR